MRSMYRRGLHYAFAGLIAGLLVPAVFSQTRTSGQTNPREGSEAVRVEANPTVKFKQPLPAVQGQGATTSPQGTVQDFDAGLQVKPKIHARQDAGKEEKPEQPKGGK